MNSTLICFFQILLIAIASGASFRTMNNDALMASADVMDMQNGRQLLSWNPFNWFKRDAASDVTKLKRQQMIQQAEDNYNNGYISLETKRQAIADLEGDDSSSIEDEVYSRITKAIHVSPEMKAAVDEGKQLSEQLDAAQNQYEKLNARNETLEQTKKELMAKQQKIEAMEAKLKKDGVAIHESPEVNSSIKEESIYNEEPVAPQATDNAYPVDTAPVAPQVAESAYPVSEAPVEAPVAPEAPNSVKEEDPAEVEPVAPQAAKEAYPVEAVAPQTAKNAYPVAPASI